MRIVLADPSAFTPPYDHALAAALARAGAEVELVTSRFRFGDAPSPDGYTRRELFYPLSSRLFRRSPLRLPLKVVEHPLGLAALLLRPADVLHVQWLTAPELDVRFLRPRVPSVFTAHDLLPRRTARKAELWRRLLTRFDRVVVHSEQGRETLATLGVDADRLRVVPHPVFPSDPERRDDGRTVLSFGVIRPYKGLADAIEAVRRAGDARLLVAGDPLEPIEPYRVRAADLDVDWRLGYLPPAEVDRAFGEATIAVFPYRPSSTRAARCCARSAPACRRSRTTWAGSRSRYGGSAPAASSRRATSKRWRRRCTSCSRTATRSSRRVTARGGRAPS